MKSPYFCAYHAEKMQACESEAIKYWSQIMQRGVKAYVECRVEAAIIYLRSALDIALLRSECQNNGIFADIHLLKPTEFLVQLYVTNDSFDEANETLSRLSKMIEVQKKQPSQPFLDFLLKEYKRVEEAENRFFGGPHTHHRNKTFRPIQDSIEASVLH